MKLLSQIARFSLGFLLGLLLGLLLLTLVAYWQKDALFGWLRDELQQQFRARIRLTAYDVEVWHSFPHIGLLLENLQMSTFQDEELFNSKTIRLEFDLYDLLVHRRYTIRTLVLMEPFLHLRWDKRGRFSWEAILGEAADTTQMAWQITKLEIRDGRVQYTDEKARLHFVVGSIHLQAGLAYAVAPDTLWRVAGRSTAQLETFHGAQGWRLPKSTLRLQTALIQDTAGLHLAPLDLELGGLALGLSGRITWTSPLRLDLRVQSMRLDWAGVSRWLPTFPEAWQRWPGRFSATGYVRGFLGAGAFPTVYLRAQAKQLKPFRIQERTLHELLGRLELLWDPSQPGRSQLLVDSLLLKIEDDQRFHGKGSYRLTQRRWTCLGEGDLDLATLVIFGLDSLAGRAQGQLSLDYVSDADWSLRFDGQGAGIQFRPLAVQRLNGSLRITYRDGWQVDFRGRLDSLLYPPGSLGAWEGEMRFSTAQLPWQLEGHGRLRQLVYPPLSLQEATVEANPTALELRQARLLYDTLSAEVSWLRLSPPAALWDSAVPSLSLEGKLSLARLSFPLPTTTESPAGRQINLNLDLSVQTLAWAERRYGPLQVMIHQTSDSLALSVHTLKGLAGGSLRGKASYTHATWTLDLTAESIDLAKLHTDFPQLDTLLPLLRHLEGRGHLGLSASLPLRHERPLWSEAHAAADLHLSRLVVRESPYTYAIFQMIPLTDFREIRVGEVHSHLRLQNGVLNLDTTELSANRWRLQVSGYHTLQGDIHYDILAEVPRPILDKSTQRVVAIVEEVEGERVLVALHMRGTVDKPTVRWAPQSPSRPRKARPSTKDSTASIPKKRPKNLPVGED